MVEQNVFTALKTIDRAYMLENGKISLERNSKEVLENEKVREIYLGI